MSLVDTRTADVRMVAASQGLSWVGDTLLPVALAVAVLADGGSASDLGRVLGIGMLCRLSTMLVGGLAADRLGPRLVMIGSDLVRAATQAGLACCFLLGEASTLVVVALFGLSNACAGLFGPAFDALRATILTAPIRQAWNARFNLLRSCALLAGPVLAGVLISTAGAWSAFAVNAMTFLLSAGVLYGIEARPTASLASTSLVEDLAVGAQAVTATPWFMVCLSAHAVWSLASGALAVIGPVVLLDGIAGESGVAAVAAFTAAGAVAGSLLAGRLHTRRPLFTGNLLAAGTALLPLAYAWPGELAAICVVAMVSRIGVQYFNVLWETLIQSSFELGLQGRISSWNLLGSYIAVPIGNVCAGPLYSRMETPILLGIVALVFAVTAVPAAMYRNHSTDLGPR